MSLSVSTSEVSGECKCSGSKPTAGRAGFPGARGPDPDVPERGRGLRARGPVVRHELLPHPVVRGDRGRADHRGSHLLRLLLPLADQDQLARARDRGHDGIGRRESGLCLELLRGQVHGGRRPDVLGHGVLHRRHEPRRPGLRAALARAPHRARQAALAQLGGHEEHHRDPGRARRPPAAVLPPGHVRRLLRLRGPEQRRRLRPRPREHRARDLRARGLRGGHRLVALRDRRRLPHGPAHQRRLPRRRHRPRRDGALPARRYAGRLWLSSNSSTSRRSSRP
ncbi:MAG: hypothetical protein UY92_C0001G0052 [Candidatus Magasanikbacteria bacterium GW2011_GWA2_56_11]|uniref:Uncharacterized protein n=1 Tax=Candidatus Magasanikbacteria bacterium GW2011_GWA2_56_11 TaxID=1619044 RepID=A0A0G1YHY0_9BACT|nr:MAG: hypothetical protein UY92_C0001G0052 [Candidatus Magasanikbacteria bacterium GW2011_GWA2_56_11]